LILECDLVGVVLANLTEYCNIVREKLNGVATDVDRKKLMIAN